MKALPLILIFSLLGVNTPFSALPKQGTPVTVVEDAAAWDALFSSESLSNVTCTTRTTIEGNEGYQMNAVSTRDGELLGYWYGDETGFGSVEKYLTEEGLVLAYSVNEEGGSFSYFRMAAEGWDAMCNFYLEGQYAGRFEEAVYEEAEGCYVLTMDNETTSVYVEDGRLVKITDSMQIGGALYHSESLFTNYGATVVDDIPSPDSAVDAETWAHAFSADGLLNCVADCYGQNASGEYSSFITIADKAVSLACYSEPTEDNPSGFMTNYAYEPAEEGVYTFAEQDYGWLVTSLDPEISWDDAVLTITGLTGMADAFDVAVYDAERGCYTFTLNQLDEAVDYAAYFVDGQLSCLVETSESVNAVIVFNFYNEGWMVEPYGPFNAVG